MFAIRPVILWGLCAVAVFLTVWRGVAAINALGSGDETEFLAYPLTVLTPALAFSYLATRRAMASDEGALMQLATMIQLLLILALPRFALYLALGFPVVFLLVELFETKLPQKIRKPLKHMVIT